MPNGGCLCGTVKTKDGKTKRQRIMTPGGQHAKELKKVYKNEKDANVSNHDRKRWWMKSFRNFELREGKLSSLAKNSAVVRTVKKYANRGSDKMMLALLSVPAVSDFLSDPANIRQS